MKIHVMSISDLLNIPFLSNSYEKAILFISTKPNYYNFGHTKFLKLEIVDSTNIVISFGTKHEFLGFALDCFSKKEIYVCCDGGISKSSAFAFALAKKLGKFEIANDIHNRFRFMNINIRNQLLRSDIK